MSVGVRGIAQDEPAAATGSEEEESVVICLVAVGARRLEHDLHAGGWLAQGATHLSDDRRSGIDGVSARASNDANPEVPTRLEDVVTRDQQQETPGEGGYDAGDAHRFLGSSRGSERICGSPNASPMVACSQPPRWLRAA